MDATTDKPQAKAGLGIDAMRYPKVRYVRWKQIKSLLYITYIIGLFETSAEAVERQNFLYCRTGHTRKSR